MFFNDTPFKEYVCSKTAEKGKVKTVFFPDHIEYYACRVKLLERAVEKG